MSHQEEAVGLAVAEVLAPSWEMTKQLLSVHEWVIDDKGKPRIDRVDDESESGAFFFYFPIRDEAYHLVVAVRPDKADCLTLFWVYLQPGIRVYLNISSKRLSPEEITIHLGLSPSETHSIGDPIVPAAPMRTHQENTWCFEPQAKSPGSFDEKITSLLNHLDPVTGALSKLKSECDIAINVLFEGWAGDAQLGGFHLDANMIQRLASYKTELDIDLHASGPTVEEDLIAD